MQGYQLVNIMDMFELDFSSYYTIIVVFDDSYQLVDYVHNIRNIIDKMAYMNLFTDIGYILDADNDGEMELIFIKPVWEGVTIFVDQRGKKICVFKYSMI